MAVRPIVLYPDPVLLKPTRPVENIDDEIRSLAEDLVDTMHAAPGIGLAANQLGARWRVCVVDLSVGKNPSELFVLVNPRIVHTEGSQIGEEGCLSFPEITLEIERAYRATVEASGLDGRSFRLTGEALLARVLQHEIEHLDGKTFLQNVSPLKRELVKKQIRKRMKAGEWMGVVAR
jgi:peptide deformylase